MQEEITEFHGGVHLEHIAEYEEIAHLEGKEELEEWDEAAMLENAHFEEQARLVEMTQLDEEDDEDSKAKKVCLLDLVSTDGAPVVAAKRRVWKKNRSQAWWDRCNEPDFPDSEFHRAFRMSRTTFDQLCEEISHVVSKEDTMLRQAIPVRQRVAVCVWRLASGEPLRLLSKRFGLGISTCHKLILEVCTAINDVLLPKYITWPSHSHAQAIRESFERITGIPDVVGAIYTSHLPIIAPKVNVTSYFNKRHTERSQKTSYSITMQGVVDAHGLFTDICIGWPGSYSDELVLEKSALYERGLDGFLHGDWVVGGASYPPLDWLLTPYLEEQLTWAQHAFNERAEEALKIVQSAFSRLKGRWQYLTKRAEIKVQELPAILGACCVLHNICEQLNEPFDLDLYFPVQDDETCCERLPWSHMSLERRELIAQSLLHSMHSGMMSY
ncbi:hypothetical protein L7F22_022706 [Adiantum nelumboides]|nr:hypothetical protein [Adiantum nelumboides]